MATSNTPPAAAAAAHAADQAGGEVIFSSDGLDPLPIPSPKHYARAFTPAAAQESGGEDGVFESDDISADQAFEVFSGKLYPGKSKAGGVSGATIAESPLQRLARLQAELAQLEEELQEDPQQQQEAESKTTTSAALKERLEKSRVLLSKRSSTLTAHLTSLASADATTTTSTSSATATPSTAAAGGTADSMGLDDRLQRLEGVVGAAVLHSSSTGSSLTGRIAALERLKSKWDEKEADALQKRAKVIRQDLEAAAKARNKLLQMSSTTGSAGSVTGSSASGAKESAKVLTDLYDLSQQLGGVSDHLPALVQRLQALAHVHADATSWASRLQASEDMARRLDSQVGVLEKSVEQVQEKVIDNIKQMQSNLKVLDERLEAVSK